MRKGPGGTRAGPRRPRRLEKSSIAASVRSQPKAESPQHISLVVGIGASAGGLEAFTRFFAHMPANSGMAFVLVQHLDPQRASMLVELLSAKTAMPVTAAADSMPVAANTVFVIPPNTVLTIADSVLRLSLPPPAREHRRPVDAFFASLAEDQGERAACIILSGGGSDGSDGVRAIKEHGGLTLAEAEYDQHAKSGMPSSAVATGLVDFVLPVEDMPARLMSYWSHLSGIEDRKGPDGARQDVDEAVTKICGLLRRALGHDFGEYKRATVVRRIQRRMQVLQIGDPADYFEHLRRSPIELDSLFRELLINVTGFFRDSEAFAAVRPMIEDIVGHKDADDQVRVWVPACATGEEAYSIAIMLAESAPNRGAGPRIQIFATDIDEQAIAAASSARYRKSLLADISEERRERWFVKEDDYYRSVKSIREMCVFSTHSVVKDPPFSKLDLIVCRNLLIYLNATLQARVLHTFHYALRPNGVLFLGGSESIGRQTGLFATRDKKHRIYQRREASSAAVPRFPLAAARTAAEAAPTPSPASGESNIDKNTRRVMEKHLPAYVVIDRNHDVVRFSGETDRYLGPSPGIASLSLFSLIRKSLRGPARAALQEASTTYAAVRRENLAVQADGHRWVLDLIVEPLGDGHFVVAFAERQAANERGASAVSESSNDGLERELTTTRERLQAAIDELETANEEMNSSNEEYSSINEELQSTNEELETSKEEMQSINEELQTVNAELNSKNDQLMRTVSDLTNLKDSTQIATIILDNALHIRDFTPATTDLFHLRDNDRGRPVTDLVSPLDYAQLQDDVANVIRDLAAVEREVTLRDTDTTFLMRALPYRTVDNVIDGVVMTFVDITDRKRHDRERGMLSAIVDSSFDAIIGHNLEGTVTSWNRAAETMFGYRPHEMVGKPMSNLFPPGRAGETPALSARIGQGEVITSFDSTLVRKDGTGIAVALTVSPVRTSGERSSRSRRSPATRRRAGGWKATKPSCCTS